MIDEYEVDGEYVCDAFIGDEPDDPDEDWNCIDCKVPLIDDRNIFKFPIFFLEGILAPFEEYGSRQQHEYCSIPCLINNLSNKIVKHYYYHWWNQNEDHLEINYKSEITIDNNIMVISCHGDLQRYKLIGAPIPNIVLLEALEETAICPDEPTMVENAARAFGCRVEGRA